MLAHGFWKVLFSETAAGEEGQTSPPEIDFGIYIQTGL